MSAIASCKNKQTQTMATESDWSAHSASPTQQNIRSFIWDTTMSDASGSGSLGPPLEHSSLDKRQLNTINEESKIDQEFGLNIPINRDDNEDGEEDVSAGSRKFHKNVKYLLNQDFAADESVAVGPNSIPNTFKNKSHPNARTKELLGEGLGLGLEPEGLEPEAPEVPESIVPDGLVPEKEDGPGTDNTPDWMPSELNERWNDEFHSSVKITKNPSLNFQFASNNSSVVHDSKNALRTPMWKKVKGNYDQNKLQPQLHQIFNSSDKSHSMSSTLSTPYNSIKQNQLTKEQISELQNLLERGRGKPDDYVMEFPPDVSPLKLWGTNYNTFTKGKLNDLLFNLAAPNFNLNLESPDQNKKDENHSDILLEQDVAKELVPSNPLPKLKTKNFNTDLDQHYKQRANDLFDNIQRRGVILKPSNGISVSNNLNHSSVHTATATSTPKLNKITDNIDDLNEYSSFTSGYEQDSTQFNSNVEENKHQPTNSNDYTSFTETNSESQSPASHTPASHTPNSYSAGMSSDLSASEIKSVSNSNLNSPSYHQSPRGQKYKTREVAMDGSATDSYTFQSESIVSRGPVPVQQSGDSGKAELEARIKELESKLSSFGIYLNNMEALINENNNLRLELHSQNAHREDEVSIDEYDMTERSMDEIKLKTLSQLRLQHLNNGNVNTMGTFKPDMKLPSHYGDMVLDEENYRWVPREDKENFNSLDSIEDLVSDQKNSVLEDEDQDHDVTIKAKEVSFHLPHSEHVKSSPMAADTTRVSQLDEVSFSQQQKRLVSIITDTLLGTKTHWNKVIDISLLGKDLFNIKDLKDFLPNLLKVDLSNNNLKFLKGLPSNLINLNLSENEIDNLTSFRDFLNLQHLNLANNLLTKSHSLKYNIHLTKLKLGGNQLTSLDGLNNLTNLVSLDVSQNKLAGVLDFKYFQFDNLQELNLSENSLEGLVNLDALTDLRVLNANENNLTKLECSGKHLHLKKLLVKFNHLYLLRLNDFPYLRTLRLDGNNFSSITGKAKYLEELSIKSQSLEFLQDLMNFSFSSLKTLDLSGNINFFQTCDNTFLNVNKLTLSAMNLTKLPDNFGELFPNVTDLNLNFNQMDDLRQLAQFKHLKRLYLVSNGVTKIELIVSNLISTRLTLKVLDLRLNPLNVDLYPYLFNPQESELGFNGHQPQNNDSDNSPIQLETLDDIENFAIHYESLNNHNNTDWEIRDKIFINNLKSHKAKRRVNYQTLLINYFPSLKKLDGSVIDFEKRLEFERNLKTTQ